MNDRHESFAAAALKAAAVWFALTFAASARVEAKIDLHRRSDGQGDVRRASFLGRDRKWDEGRRFIAELRARPAKGKNIEELQSIDMAEFALLRHDAKANRARCIECLEAVHSACPTSFWGWAAYTYLKDFGVDAHQPPKDPLRGLGKLGDGVVNLEPQRLQKDGGRPVPNVGWIKDAGRAVPAGRALKADDLKPGSPLRRAILRKRLVEICGEKKIAEIAGCKGGSALLRRLWDDDAALEDFLLSGPVFDGPVALETLATLWLNDEAEGWAKTDMGRRATIAVAINARSGDDMAGTVRHWAAFRRLGMWDRFVKGAKMRDCREWRFIVRRPLDPADILYLNATRRFPTRYKRNVGLKGVPYRKKNCFAVSKWAKNDAFMRPWLASGWPRQYIRSRVGGVCTEQAMWAAICANAHGMMAERAGQPGHCCWLLNENGGGWSIISGVRPYTAGVFHLWGSGFQYIASTERAFADRTAHDESELLMFAGRLKEAALRCPYNYTAWRAYANSLKAAGANAETWHAYLGELLAGAPAGRLVSWDFAWEAVEAMAAGGMDAASLAKETARVFKGLAEPKEWIAEEMNYNKAALDRFLRRFAKNDELTMKILAVALEANKDGSRYLPQIFGYALRRWSNDKEKLGRFFDLWAQYAGRGGGGETNWRRLSTLKGCMDDRATFRMMADFRNKADPPKGEAKVPSEDYGAALVSRDALVKVSSRGKDDTPEDWPRVSDLSPYDPKRAGNFATKSEPSPWVAVELAGDAVIKGVTVAGDASGLKAWVSQDGKDWKEIASGGGDAKGWRIGLDKNQPTAKFVKIGRADGAGKPLRLLKVLVYGSKLY